MQPNICEILIKILLVNNVKMELSSRVRSHVSHRLFRKKTTFDDHQIETFLDDISGAAYFESCQKTYYRKNI